MSIIDYHLRELVIAKNSLDKRFSLPKLLHSDRVIVDVGCGIGQSFVALGCLDRTCIGIDISIDAISYGRKRFGDHIDFYVADASNLPIESDLADIVLSRVSLPYTNIHKALIEIKRILRPGGRVWLTLHSKRFTLRRLWSAAKALDARDFIYTFYILVNGYYFMATHHVLPFVNGKYESWQDLNTMRWVLRRLGFETRLVRYQSVVAVEGILI